MTGILARSTTGRPFEPESRITNFDRMRLHYVAFLAARRTSRVDWPPAAQGALPSHLGRGFRSGRTWRRTNSRAQTFESRDRQPVKKSYSFTGDLRIYETCPRQYRFFRDYDFTPSRSAVIFFGFLVHQSIEEIHRVAMDGRLSELDEAGIRDLFDRTFPFPLPWPTSSPWASASGRRRYARS